MATILITGGAGLIGSRLAEWILANTTDKVVIVDNLSGGYLDNIPLLPITDLDKRLRFRNFNVESSDLEQVFMEFSPDYVVHMAAYAAEGLSDFIRTYNYTNNLLATTNIVNMCIKYKVQRIVFTSSLAVYGNAIPPFSEDMIPHPHDVYGVAKYACEMDIRIAGEHHELDWCVIRPHNVYGRNQNIWDVYRNVLGIWMYNHLNDKPFTIYGDGLQTRAFSCIDDSVAPFYRAIMDPKASRQIINLGGIYETTILDAAHTLSDVVGGATIEMLPARHEVKHAFTTYSKSVNILGFEHKTELHTGLVDMWQWAQKQPVRERFVWDKYELDVGMYPFWKKENLAP